MDQNVNVAGATVSRRRVLQAAAWAAPAIVIASAAPAYAASGPNLGAEWIFRGDSSYYNAGYYDLKSQMWRNSELPNYNQVQNNPHVGPALITIYLHINMAALDGAVPFFAVDPNNPFGGTRPITLNTQTTGDGWYTNGSIYSGGILRIAITNTTQYTNFNPGRAIQNVFVVVPTTNPGQNGWQKNGSQHLQVSFTAPDFVTRGPENLI